MRFASSLLLLAGATTLVAAADPVPLGRLPAGVKPTAYRLDLTVDPAKTDYAGHTEIDAEVAAPRSSLFLHGLGLQVASVTATVGGKTIMGKYAEVDPSGVARLDFASPLPAGKVTLKFDYITGFRSGAEGLFHAKVGDNWYAWTQMEPLDARRMFPGFDEPGFKTPFTVTITAPSTVKAFANAPELGATSKGGMTVHRFAPTQKLPTYLVAIAVGDFDVVGTTIPANKVRKTPLDFRVLATKGQAPRMATTIAETPKIVGLLEDYFGIPYPYEKLDFVASPVMGGAMENAGLIVFSDELILLDRDAPFRQLRSFGEVTAHELAHQWFGDLVTPTWWTDIWLNESFASWMGNKIGESWRPDLGTRLVELDEAFGAMDTDALGKGRPIRQTIERNDQVTSAFDGITYQKGAQVVSMFEGFVGPESFRKGVQLHLNRYAHGNASAEDFFASVGEAADNKALVKALRSFTDQTGVPVVTVAEAPAGITLSQARYRPIGVDAAGNQQWVIPMSLARGNAKASTLLEAPSATIAAVGGAGALHPNADGAGYYRFSPAGGWDPLLATAATLPDRDAMAVADSLWADFAAGKTGFTSVEKGAAALAPHKERLAALGLGYRLAGLADTLLTDDQLPAYRRMMASIYTPRLLALGTDPRPGAYKAEPVPQQQLRLSLMGLVANEARDPQVRATLARAGAAVVAGDMAAVDPALRGLALGVAVQEGGVPFMEKLSAALTKSDNPLFRGQAALALGYAQGAEPIAAAQRLATAPGMQSLETVRVIQSLGNQRAARDSTIAFTNANFTRLMESFPGFARPGIIGIYDGFCETGDVAKVDAMLTPKLPIIGGGALELAQTKERIAKCAALKAAKGGEIAAVLARY